MTELPELDEPPAYFTRELRQSSEMDWWELSDYINRLRRSGFDVARFTVRLHKKLTFPLIAPIVIMLAIPFSILVGNRGGATKSSVSERHRTQFRIGHCPDGNRRRRKAHMDGTTRNVQSVLGAPSLLK